MNWIPKIVYNEIGTATLKTVTFDYPPDGDPYNEKRSANSTTTRSTSGKTQTQYNYNTEKFTLEFKFQSQDVMDDVIDFIDNHAFYGGSFKYYPSSDEVDYDTYEYDGNSLSIDRPIPNGTGGFEYNFKFSILRAIATPFETVIDITGVDGGFASTADAEYTGTWPVDGGYA